IVNAIPKDEGPVMVKVLIAKEDIDQGAVLSEAVTAWISFPERNVPEFYVTEENGAFTEQLGQTRARRHIRASEPLTMANTVRHGEKGMLAAIMTEGMRAVSMGVSATQTSGGFVLPGDRVDIFATGLNPDDDVDASTSWMVFSNVRVLAVDQVASSSDETDAIVGKTVTLEIEPEQVASFLEARSRFTLTLVLRSVFEGARTQSVEQTTPDEVVIIRYGQG
ncbi:MAG: Flp pilus assembly protein CpaB, partial [Pseudomonadota bacterium]